MKKHLVVYYSMTSYTQRVAEVIAEVLNCDIEAISEKRPRRGLRGTLSAMKDVLFKGLPEVEDPLFDPKEYDMVIIGTPVWANKACLPVVAWFEKVERPFPEVSFFITTKVSKEDTAFKHLTELSGKEPFKKFAILNKKMDEKAWEKEVIAFAEELREV